jgi:membrane fusion protein, multidrug efflux system
MQLLKLNMIGNHNTRAILLSVTGVTMLAASALLVTACSSANSKAATTAPPSVPVDTVRVRQENVPLIGDWVGTLDGFVNAQIQPQVIGYLVQQNYLEVSSVAKDQVLFQIDRRPFQATVDQAAAQVEQAKGQLAQAKAQQSLAQINLKRDTPLAEARAISQSQLDNDTQQAEQAGAAVTAARAAVSAAEAALATANLNLGFTEVRSLVSGIAGQATTQVGNLVNPQPVLTSVSKLDPIKVYFSISDAEYLALTDRAHIAGSNLLGGRSELALTLILADGKVWQHTGQIVFVERQMNQQTGAIRIAASFPNPGNVLRPGQFGRVTAQTEIRQNAILVPQMAVQELQGTKQVLYRWARQQSAHRKRDPRPPGGKRLDHHKRITRGSTSNHKQRANTARRRADQCARDQRTGGYRDIQSNGSEVRHVQVLHSPPHCGHRKCDSGLLGIAVHSGGPLQSRTKLCSSAGHCT